MDRNEELRRLRQGPAASEEPRGLVRYLVRGEHPAVALARAAEVLSVVLELGAEPWPGFNQWARALPSWFVDGCRATTTPDEVDRWLERWRTLDTAARRAAEEERGWTLDDWLFWLEPAERQWFWWDAVHHSGLSELLIVVDAWPYADGALRWLLHVAGASVVEVG